MIDSLKLEAFNLKTAQKPKTSRFRLFQRPGPQGKKAVVRGNLAVFAKPPKNSDFPTNPLLPLLRIEQNLSKTR